MSFPTTVPSNTDLPINYVNGNVLPATVVNENNIDTIAIAAKLGTGPSTPTTTGQVLTVTGTGVTAYQALPASSASVTATGDVTGSTTTGAITLTLAPTAVTPGTYNFATVTVDAKGRLTAASSATSPLAPRVVTGTYTSTLTVPNTQEIYRLVLTGNPTIGIANGAFDGQKTELHLIQDSTGNRTVTFGASVKFGTSSPQPTLSTAASAVDVIGFRWDATSAKWRAYGSLLGF